MNLEQYTRAAKQKTKNTNLKCLKRIRFILKRIRYNDNKTLNLPGENEEKKRTISYENWKNVSPFAHPLNSPPPPPTTKTTPHSITCFSDGNNTQCAVTAWNCEKDGKRVNQKRQKKKKIPFTVEMRVFDLNRLS